MSWMQRFQSLPTALLPSLTLVAGILILPPLGAIIAGQPLALYLQLPLETRAWDPLPMDPVIFTAFSIAIMTLIGCLLWFARPRRPANPQSSEGIEQNVNAEKHGHFPRWGVWGGLSIGAAISAALASLSGLSQPLLVLGLTLLIASHTQWRTGTSLVSQRPGFFLALYPASALIGWLFHWIDLFLQLWVYPGAGAESAIPFVLVRSLDYATLLPALLVLRQWLGGWRPLLHWCSSARGIDGSAQTQEGWWYLAAGSIGLLGATLRPDWIWPLTWVAPLLLIIGIQLVSGRPTLFSGTRNGDWSRILIPALAALMLGLVIQGWNTLVGPAWVFDLPLIQSWVLFGLPLPAYAGMLPLGILGVWIGDQLAYPWHQRPQGQFREFPIRVSINR